MTKTIAKWLALALCAALTLSGCGLVTVDKALESARNDAQVVAEFTGGTVTLGEANAEYQSMAAMYEQYGYPLTDPDDIKQAKQDVLDTLVQQHIVKAKAQEMGLVEISEAEKAELAKKAEAEYEEAIAYYAEYFQGDTDEATRKNTVDYLTSAGYTLESIQQYYTENAWQDKIKAEITKDVTVTDEQVKAAYDASVAEDQQTFTEDNYYFENAASYGDTIAWIPEGYRAVKHILLKLSDEDSTALLDLTSQLEDVNVRIEELKNPSAAVEDAEEGDASAFADAVDAADAAAAAAEPDAQATPVPGTEPEAAAEEALSSGDQDFTEEGDLDAAGENVTDDTAALDKLTLPELETRKAELEGQIEALKAACLAKLQPTVTEIQSKIQAGEDFDKLIEQYGQDEGMKSDPTKSTGYYVSEGSQMWDDEFTTGAMALQKVGDVSGPVLSQSGVHLIKYIGDLTPGAVPLAQIESAIRQEALDEAQNALYDSTVGKWVAEANVKTYVDRMG